MCMYVCMSVCVYESTVHTPISWFYKKQQNNFVPTWLHKLVPDWVVDNVLLLEVGRELFVPYNFETRLSFILTTPEVMKTWLLGRFLVVLFTHFQWHMYRTPWLLQIS